MPVKLGVLAGQALKKALYKPAAFYKGIVLPLCESGTCTLREATVLSSVIKKVPCSPRRPLTCASHQCLASSHHRISHCTIIHGNWPLSYMGLSHSDGLVGWAL